MDLRTLIYNFLVVAKIVKLYQLAIVLATVNVKNKRNEPTIHQLDVVLTMIETFDRTTMNAWEDNELVNAIKAIGLPRL